LWFFQAFVGGIGNGDGKEQGFIGVAGGPLFLRF
jgi:hypothetical protein